MKKFSYIFALALGMCLMACTGNNDNQQLQQQQQVPAPTAQQQPAQVPPADAQAQPAAPAATPQAVPEAIDAFIKQHFPNATVVGVEPDQEHGGLEYDIYLSDGTQIDFDTNNQWEKIECRNPSVPASFIPQAIATYVKSNYQNTPIVKIDKKYNNYEIELSNGLELRFDQSGRFMGIDD